jgi:type II secretory pathway pseudopilin PulG
MFVVAYIAAVLVVLILLVILAAVGFDKGMRSRDFIVFEILVALIMLAILATFWIGALNDWRLGEG